MYREEYWKKGYYIVNHQKYNCLNCGKDFIIGKELLDERVPNSPICPYCGQVHVECVAETDDEFLQRLAGELGCLGIYLDEETQETEIIGHVEKTGHLYKRLLMEDIESVDNCAACDEAWCDMCVDLYIVEDWKEDKLLYKGRDKEKAIEIAGYDFT